MSEENLKTGREGFIAGDADWKESLSRSIGEVSFELEWVPTEAGREILEAQRNPIVGREVRFEMNGRVYMGKVTGFDNENFTLTVELREMPYDPLQSLPSRYPEKG